MSDPLSLLREFTIQNKKVVFKDDYLILDNAKFHRDTKTNYRSQKGKGKAYELGAVWFLLQHAESTVPQYLRDAQTQKFPLISQVDKKDLLAYLRGDIETSEAIVIAPVAPAEEERPTKKRRTEDQTVEGAAKPEPMQVDSVGVPKKELKPVVEVDPAVANAQEAAKRERMLRTRKTILLCPKKTFSDVVRIVNEHRMEQESAHKRYTEHKQKKSKASTDSSVEPMAISNGVGAALPAAAAVVSSPAVVRTNSDNQRSILDHLLHYKVKPIIVVPAGQTALLTVYNAKELLEEGVFVTTQERKNQGAKKPPSLEIMHTIKDNPISFEVIDSTDRLSRSEWKRVVAVFAQGPEWQFKDWPFEGNMVNLFQHVRGFHLKYHDAEIPATIKSWNVKTLSVHRSKRHLDRTVANDFWEALVAFLLTKRSTAIVP